MIDIRCCDNLELMAEIKDNTVDLIILDPISNSNLVKDKWDDRVDNYPEYILTLMIECERILSDTGSIYIFQWIGKKNPIDMANVIITINKNTNLIFQNFITWKKNRGFGVKKNWMYAREEVLFYTKTDNYTFNVQYSESLKRNYIRKNGISYFKRASNVWIDINEASYENIQEQDYSLNRNFKKLNSTQKPKALIQRIIKASSNEGDLVADFYAGSFTTAEVCQDLNRNFIGCDINPNAYEIGKKRVGKKNI